MAPLAAAATAVAEWGGWAWEGWAWVGATATIAGTGYSIYSGLQQQDAMDDAQDEARAAMNAQRQLSQEEWLKYRDTGEPLLTEMAEGASRGTQQQPYLNQASAGATQGVSQQRGILGALGDPTERKFQNANAMIGARGGISEGLTQNAMRDAMRTQDWERKLGVSSIGRGMSGNVLSGYASVANQMAKQAQNYGAAAKQSFSQAMQMPGLLQSQMKQA